MRIAVVGAGVAGGTAVEELRAAGHEGEIALFAAETHLPYNRPPLSKGLLLGTETEESIFLHDADWYAEQQVELHLGEPVLELDADRSLLVTRSGSHDYDRLLLATGATPRRLALADGSGVPVQYLRTLEDSRALHASFEAGRRLVVIGAGWIGLEAAAAAVTAGMVVTVVESLPLPLARVLGDEVAGVFADLHRAKGVDLRLGAVVEEVSTETSSTPVVVRLADGGSVEGDLLLVGIGVQPDVDLAHEAGLPVDNGVLVDPWLRAADPHVFAAGDIANHQHPVLERRVRVEHWDTAIEQARVAAHNMLGGDEQYTRLPYFFTDQYDLGMEYVGSVGPDAYDTVVTRGSTADLAFTAFWLRGDHVLAGMHVNEWDAIDPIRSLVGRRVDPAQLRDASVDLAGLAGA